MARSFLTPLDLNKNEIRNAVVQNLGAAPSTPVKGQLYFDTTTNILYWCQNPVGPVWVAAMSGASLTPATTVTTQAVGDAGAVGAAVAYAREDHKHGMPSFGNVTAQTTFGGASGNGAAVSLARSDHTHGTPTHDAAAHSAIPISALAAATAAINMGGFTITNVGTPTNPTDASTKGYVDNAIAGLSWKDSVRLVSNGNTSASGNQTIDGVVTAPGDRVLLTFQSVPETNGIYVTAAGAWQRATDADTGAELLGAAVFVEEGTAFKDTAWVCSTNAPIVMNTTALTWVQFAGGGTIVAGNGLTQTGNTIDVGADNASVAVSANGIQVAYAGSAGNFGTALSAARSDHLHSGTYLDQSAGDARYGRKFSADAGAATSSVINHALNTRDVTVNVYRTTTPWDTVDCDIERTDVNNVTVRFAVAPAAGAFRVVIVG